MECMTSWAILWAPRTPGILSPRRRTVTGFLTCYLVRSGLALTMTTEFVEETLAELFHEDADSPDQVEPARILNIVAALDSLIVTW